MIILECNSLSKNYGKIQALKNVDIKIKKGRIIGLLGANGSGKTTLIKLINGLLTPTKGEVLINGIKPGIESKKVISYLPEKTYLDLSLTVEETIKYFKDFYENFNIERAYDILKKLKIDSNRKLKTLSKGTKEKVQLMLVMSRDAELYVLDEPIGGVDPAARDLILDTILTNFNKNASIIISTHLIADIEKILDDVIFISNGEIELFEEADKLRNKRKKSIDAIFREDYYAR